MVVVIAGFLILFLVSTGMLLESRSSLYIGYWFEIDILNHAKNAPFYSFLGVLIR